MSKNCGILYDVNEGNGLQLAHRIRNPQPLTHFGNRRKSKMQKETIEIRKKIKFKKWKSGKYFWRGENGIKVLGKSTGKAHTHRRPFAI